MNSKNSVNWNLLLDSKEEVSLAMQAWSAGNMSTREVANELSHTQFAGEFRKLVRSRGTAESRRLARKALRYRGLV